MGWWSETVMGGDTPHDYKYEIYNNCGVSFNSPTPILRKALLSHEKELLAFAEGGHWDNEIRQQVCGYLVITNGVPRSEAINKVISLAIESAEGDEWAKENQTRKKYMDDFIAALKSYNGEPTEVKDKGLFEVIATHLAEGKTGLVNKPGP